MTGGPITLRRFWPVRVRMAMAFDLLVQIVVCPPEHITADLALYRDTDDLARSQSRVRKTLAFTVSFLLVITAVSATYGPVYFAVMLAMDALLGPLLVVALWAAANAVLFRGLRKEWSDGHGS